MRWPRTYGAKSVDPYGAADAHAERAAELEEEWDEAEEEIEAVADLLAAYAEDLELTAEGAGATWTRLSANGRIVMKLERVVDDGRVLLKSEVSWRPFGGLHMHSESKTWPVAEVEAEDLVQHFLEAAGLEEEDF